MTDAEWMEYAPQSNDRVAPDPRLVWLVRRAVIEWGYEDVCRAIEIYGLAPSAPISGLADPAAPYRANPHFPARCPHCNGMAWCDCIDREPQPDDGPDYHADHAAWERRQAEGAT